MPPLVEHANALREIVSDLSTLTVAQTVNLFRQYGAEQGRDEMAELVKQALPQIVEPHAQASALITAQWYDELAPEIAEFHAAPAVDLLDPGRIDRTTRWAFYAPGGADPVTRLSGAVQRMVFDASRKTVLDNAAAEGVIGWARHAQPDACAFCRMLATRTTREDGLYRSEESAVKVVGRSIDLTNADRRMRAAGLASTDELLERRANYSRGSRRGQKRGRAQRGVRALGEKYHDFCRCVAVPVRAGGYEPPEYVAEWEKQYVAAVKAAEKDGKTRGEYGAIDPKAILAKMREADGGDAKGRKGSPPPDAGDKLKHSGEASPKTAAGPAGPPPEPPDRGKGAAATPDEPEPDPEKMSDTDLQKAIENLGENFDIDRFARLADEMNRRQQAIGDWLAAEDQWKAAAQVWLDAEDRWNSLPQLADRGRALDDGQGNRYNRAGDTQMLRTMANRDWRYIEDADDRATASLQFFHEDRGFIERVAENLGAGRDAFEGVTGTQLYRRTVQFYRISGQYEEADFQADLLAAATRLMVWTAQDELLEPAVYRGITLPPGTTLSTLQARYAAGVVEGGTPGDHWSYASVSPRHQEAEAYAVGSGHGIPVVFEIRGARGAKLNPVGRMFPSTERIVNGLVRVLLMDASPIVNGDPVKVVVEWLDSRFPMTP